MREISRQNLSSPLHLKIRIKTLYSPLKISIIVIFLLTEYNLVYNTPLVAYYDSDEIILSSLFHPFLSINLFS